MKLTEEQSIIVADNHSLIYWYAHKIGKLNLDEWYDLLAIELCYAVMKYDSTKGSLANYYKLRCDGLVYKEYRKSQSQKRLCEEVVYIDEVGYIDKVRSVDHLTPLEDTLEFKELIDAEDGIILRMKYEGYTQTEIANKLKVSQSYISKVLRKLKDKYEFDRSAD